MRKLRDGREFVESVWRWAGGVEGLDSSEGMRVCGRNEWKN